jgi:2-methylcitrate dehydratase PrpD
MTIAEQLAAEAKELTFRELPPEVVHQAKRCVLDTVGIGLGGYLSEPSQIIQSLIKEMNGPAESTVFGSGLKTSCLYATLANGAMVRYTEFMDSCRLTKEGHKSVGHQSECIPPILAVGERQHSAGQEVITAIASPGIVEITTKKGQKYRCEVFQPNGHPMNPMSDADVEEKFRSMAGKVMGEKQMSQIIDTVYNLEKVGDIGELLNLLVVSGQIT